MAQQDRVAVIAAGDIADCRTSGAEHTAGLLDDLDGVILALGDLAYDRGSAEEFHRCYGPTWGRHKARTRPAPGNHEYETPQAAGYFAYWGARAGKAGQGFYSFDLGAWHIVALNSNIAAAPGSAQELWLRRDLAATGARCILAFWHHPVFSSGPHGDIPTMRALVRRLHEAGASVVLAGHDHLYERFAPQDPDGRLDARGGIRAFTVGTGGARLYHFRQARPNSEFRYRGSWGLLRLALEPDGYAWEFLAVDGRRIDAGRAACVARNAGHGEDARGRDPDALALTRRTH
ncbi:MAG: metallophosphoesterase family protein [Kiloniellaceae bacterium]